MEMLAGNSTLRRLRVLEIARGSGESSHHDWPEAGVLGGWVPAN